MESLSARRAWIEIAPPIYPLPSELPSLSARRAWIEIHPSYHEVKRGESLSARRAWIEMHWPDDAGGGWYSRSPQGERGLKSEKSFEITLAIEVALRKESVD